MLSSVGFFSVWLMLKIFRRVNLENNGKMVREKSGITITENNIRSEIYRACAENGMAF